MSSQCFSILKHDKVQFKQQEIIQNQLNNQQSESFLNHPAMHSPLSGKSQCMTESGSTQKTSDKMIEEIQDTQRPCEYEIQLSKIDNNEYFVQTICFKNRQELDQVIKQYKQPLTGLYLPIVECLIEEEDENKVKLKIITQKFQYVKKITNYESFCNLMILIISNDIKFESNDIIQFFDQQLLINPVALFRTQKSTQLIHKSLITLFQRMEINEEVQQIINLIIEFETGNIYQMKSFQITNKHIYMFQQKLINMLLRKILESQF